MRKVFGLLVLFAGMAHAQQLDTLALDTAKKEPPTYYGAVYLDASGLLGPNISGVNISTSIGIGIQYEKWTLSFSQVDFQGNEERFLVFPNTFELNYRYAGPQIGYQVFGVDEIKGEVQLSYYWGDMIWREQESQVDFLRDEFNMVSLAAKIHLDMFRYAKPNFIVGYQRLNDLSLAQANNADFSGVFFGLGIRIGYFNQ